MIIMDQRVLVYDSYLRIIYGEASLYCLFVIEFEFIV